MFGGIGSRNGKYFYKASSTALNFIADSYLTAEEVGKYS